MGICLGGRYHFGDNGIERLNLLLMTRVYAKIKLSNNRKDDFIWETQ